MTSHLSPVSSASEASCHYPLPHSPIRNTSQEPIVTFDASLHLDCPLPSLGDTYVPDFSSSISFDEALASSPTTPRPGYSCDEHKLQCDSATSPRDDLRPVPAPLLDHEQNMLDAMCSLVDKHQSRRTTIVADISKVGNASFIPARHILIEWMFDLCHAFNLQNTTLHAAIHYVDVYMSRCRCTQRSWQLLAASALFVAAKFEENADVVPSLREIRSVCGNPIFTVDCVKSMELLILDVFNWNPMYRGAVHFLGFNLNTMRRIFEDTCNENLAFSPISTDGIDDSGEICRSRKKRSRAEMETLDDIVRNQYVKIRKRESLTCAKVSTQDLSPVRSYPGATCRIGARKLGEDIVSLSDLDEEYISDLEDAGRVASCILDSTLYDPVLCAVQNPRHLAAAALFIARQMQGSSPVWSEACATATGLIETDFNSCTALLLHAVRNADASEVVDFHH